MGSSMTVTKLQYGASRTSEKLRWAAAIKFSKSGGRACSMRLKLIGGVAIHPQCQRQRDSAVRQCLAEMVLYITVIVQD